jgi:hypothetical protein
MEVCASELYTGQNKIPIVSCYRQHAWKSSWEYGKNSSHNLKVNSWLAKTLTDTIIRGVIRKTVLLVFSFQVCQSY